MRKVAFLFALSIFRLGRIFDVRFRFGRFFCVGWFRFGRRFGGVVRAPLAFRHVHLLRARFVGYGRTRRGEFVFDVFGKAIDELACRGEK